MAATDIKKRHRAMWASGDYPTIAEIVAPVSEHMVRAAGVREGQRVLDVASGTGSSAIPAARTGAQVIASDLTPELFEPGRARAADEGLELEWMEADAESLPFEDASFDVVMSAIGAMFAPNHEAVARELLRVCRPGGTVAMANWTPEGLIGQMFKLMGPYAPPPPPGAQPPPLWGSEGHVSELLGDGLSDLKMERHILSITELATPDDYVDLFKHKYGPTIAVQKNIGDDEERLAEFDAKYREFARNGNSGTPDAARFDQEYLLVVGKRAG
ncbi:MAG: methyltransferase domain-containing protein [Actinomycetota bacterium]|nr:methyltransferase domain-containing protein [Actinomycetota bacterium]MDQ5808923.1 methyltransferase domain-containing protein [Actinomycetota bacterium]